MINGAPTQSLQFETREGLERNTKNAATKGGVLERGIEYERSAKVLDISFMTGLTGIGYYLERYIDDSIPSVLAFETM